MNKKIKISIIVIVILILAGSLFYLMDYRHADKTATDLLNGSENVSVKKVSNGLFLDGSGNESSVIFYPGAKNEYTSYLPLLMNLAEKGVDCYLVEMPFNFALFAKDSAYPIINSTNYSHYFLAGHSLGGFSASSFASSSNETDGVILLAAYPGEEIDKPVLSIYGSEDQILNRGSYDKSKPLMSNLTEIIIDGGNHGQFANCGFQDGDGVGKISAQNQQGITVSTILEFIDNVTLVS